MAYSVNGVVDLTPAMEHVYQHGWACVDELAAPRLFECLDEEAHRALDESVPTVDFGYGITTVALSAEQTPRAHEFATALAEELTTELARHDVPTVLAYTNGENTAEIVRRQPPFDIPPHNDAELVGVNVNLCIATEPGNTIVIGRRNRIDYLGNRAVLFAGNNFGLNPSPLHQVPPLAGPRTNLQLAHRDPALCVL